jgi:Tfp pilus assembly protein FimT
MFRTVPALVAVLAVLGTPAFAQLARDAAIARAEAILRDLQDGRTADVVKAFDDRMAQELPEAKLKGAWSALVAQFGAFKAIQERREGPMKDRQAVELILAFEKETIVHRTVFDQEGRVAGLAFRPLSMAILPASK